MLERHPGNRIAFIHVANDADEARHSAHLGIATTQRGNLSAYIKIGVLDSYRHRVTRR
ncbi:hypothetical protein D3C83_196580 [compost metagenome]